MSGQDERTAIWAIVPVKALAKGKSRLRLSQGERRDIVRGFVARVIAVVCDVLPARNVVVTSRDEEVLALARTAGVRALREAEGGDLNDALGAAALFAQERGALGVLSVFADLPYLTADDLDAMIEAFDGSNLVIAPDVDGAGSNALLMQPRAIPYRHGRNSFWRHLDAARDAGRPFVVTARTGLMHDIDTPDHLSAYAAEQATQAKRDLHPHD